MINVVVSYRWIGFSDLLKSTVWVSCWWEPHLKYWIAQHFPNRIPVFAKFEVL